MLLRARKVWRNARTSFFTWKAIRSVGSHGPNVRVNGHSDFTRTTHLGANTHFNGMSIRGIGRVEIGDNFHSGTDCMVLSDIHNYSGDALPYDTKLIERPVKIGRNVWLGVRVIVLGGVTIGDGAIIQAGSVVVSDIPPLAIAGGHPARVFGQRDEEHYKTLDAAGKYT